MTTSETDVLSALRAALVGQVGQDRYDLWFATGASLHLEAGRLRVASTTPFVQEYLRSNLRRELELSCQQALGQALPIEFEVSTDTAVALQVEAVAELTDEVQAADRMARPAGTVAVPIAAASVARSAGNTVSTSRRRPWLTLEKFVVGRTNRVAATAAMMAVDRPGSPSLLFLHGPTGVGKTHLLEGIYSGLRQTHPQQVPLCLTAEQFTTIFLAALNGGGLPSFRRKYRGVDCLVLDDVQFLSGKRATAMELLHTIDALQREGRQCILAADRAPAELTGLGPEIITRLSGGLVCRLEAPDYDTRLGIVQQLAADYQLPLPLEVAQYVARHMTQHARQLSGAMHALEATSRAWLQPISLTMAEEALCEQVRHAARCVRLDDIERAVCQVLGLEPESLHGGGKSKSACQPRMLAMWLARKHTRAALSEIGRYFGRRSHSTVVTAQQQVNRWMSQGQSLGLADRPWSVEEAVRRIEDQLRVG